MSIDFEANHINTEQAPVENEWEQMATEAIAEREQTEDAEAPAEEATEAAVQEEVASEAVPEDRGKIVVRTGEKTGKAIKRDYAVQVLRTSIHEAKDAEKFAQAEALANAILEDKESTIEEKQEVANIKESDVYKEESLRAQINNAKSLVAKRESELHQYESDLAELNVSGTFNKIRNRSKIHDLQAKIAGAKKEIQAANSELEGAKAKLIELVNKKSVEADVTEGVEEQAPVVAEVTPEENDVEEETEGVAEEVAEESATEEAPVKAPEKPAATRIPVVEAGEKTEEKTDLDSLWGDNIELKFVRSAKYADDLRKDPNLVIYPSDQQNWNAVKKEDALSVLEDKIMNGDIDDDKEMFETNHLIEQIIKKDSGFSEEEINTVKQLKESKEFREKKRSYDLRKAERFLKMRKEDLERCYKEYENLTGMKYEADSTKKENVITGFLRHWARTINPAVRQSEERIGWTTRDVNNAEKDIERLKGEVI